MSVSLRMARRGRKKMPVYHIVAADKREPRDGRFIEKLGNYNPNVAKEERLVWNADKVAEWLNKGAVPSATVARFILEQGIGTDAQRKRFETKRNERINAVQARLAKEKAKADAEAAAEKAEAEVAEAEAAAEAAPAEESPAEETAEAAAPAEDAKAEDKPAEEAQDAEGDKEKSAS